MNLVNNRSDTEVSVEILRQAVPKMSELDIPVTPDNYAVWYEYYLGINLALKRAIDGLLANGVTFTRDVNAELYNNYIQENSPEVIENVQNETQVLLNSLLAKIASMSRGNAKFHESLTKFDARLKSNPDQDTLQKLVDDIVEELQQTMTVSDEMELSLISLNDEVKTLKSEMQALHRVAMTDQLTSLYNRRAFDDEVISHLENYNQSRLESSLLVVDIDHFKQFNDIHGHAIGDKVLAYVALALKQGLKGEDFVARYGGEEFVILLPNTKHEEAKRVAEDLRGRIADRRLTIGKDKKLSLGNITVSVGVASLKPMDDEESYFIRADKALYRAKSAGRNCVYGETGLAGRCA